ncbi:MULTISPECIES: division/cell wall cluster transcriptional repressor MraZ [Hydrogenovibrio]|jgi:MraZ protein|uniref:Transcriptional regulator MraZ n=1 Tax=Hydrogenovibrio marinus TaxID=28885 RepID=A0A066ZSQ9_HYDMR|nr:MULTISPECIES: division/cell wall cluster transcriptional repressor MraZ [Hydrogenovibrio]KDN96843.1 cell division protein MraZ [Hydrogenovibrio marinus]MBD3821885.1 division/cell wall cluster transcriptional repressor MraZ [Thiotrichales bacterium]MPQ75558.1 division/cell wall cluster transcriptional repressor MraZ [Hydrogenovibrio sp. JE_KL2]BBN59100.1 transcriptional regulator MraZ [Hydrogenovibrio marinus]
MLFFRGINSINMDTKGRLAIPKKYRESIEEASESQLVATIDLNSPCLLIYTMDEWEVIERKLMSLPNMDPQARLVQRLLLGHASEMEMDSQGRILLPSMLREHAKLDKNVILLGQGNKFELWSQEAWDASRPDMLDTASTGQVSDALSTLSL